jgi:hypothetical protein
MSYAKLMMEAHPLYMTAAEICEESGGDTPCDEDECPNCCQHEWDSSEGFMCLNCGSEYPY